MKAIEQEQMLMKRPQVKGVAWKTFENCDVVLITEPASGQDFCPQYWISIFAVVLIIVVLGLLVISIALFFIVRYRRRTRTAA